MNKQILYQGCSYVFFIISMVLLCCGAIISVIWDDLLKKGKTDE